MSKYTTELRYVCEAKAMVGYPVARSVRGFSDHNIKEATMTEWEMLEPYLFEFPKNTGGRYPEEYYVLARSVGEEKVDTVLDFCWNHIFKESAPITGGVFEEHYPELCRKILKHYYTREICCETAGLWILWANQRMEEIAPYYAQLYQSVQMQADINPLEDTDITRMHTREGEGNEAVTNQTDTHEESTGSGSRNVSYGGENKTDNRTTDDRTIHKEDTGNKTGDYNYSDDGSSMDKYADTPQGSVSTPIFDSYLTNARSIGTDSSGSSHDDVDTTLTNDTTDNVIGTEDKTETRTGSSQTGTSESRDSSTGVTETGNKHRTGNETVNETIIGKRGTTSYSKLLQEYRETFLNIDSLVIREFRDLFFLLW